jgi:hypothetical protein
LGYCKSYYNYGYSSYDYTYSINGGCRYQTIRSADNHWITYRDGPEPNCQPWYCCNGNPDLGWPWALCVVDTVRYWHDQC